MNKNSVQTPHSSTRRRLLQSLPCLSLLALPRWALAQGVQPVAVEKLHSFTLQVSDVGRSLAFYQDLFAAPVQARQGETLCLRIGDGPRHFALAPLPAGTEPRVSHMGLSVANFDIEAVREQLLHFGISRAPVPEPGQSSLHSALQSWVVTRGPDAGGAQSGTQELYFADIEGLVFQLSGTGYCGGGGATGEECATVEAAPAPGMMQLVDISHFTNFVSNSGRANAFYTRAFGKQYQAYQGAGSPIIGVGDGIQFLMFIGGDQAGPPQSAATIHHPCFSVSEFDVDRIRGQLTDYGLSPLADGETPGPLKHWISLRMPNRGGAPGGTPELYFTDPDGIRIQLQDPGYCGGSGYLGDSCPSL